MCTFDYTNKLKVRTVTIIIPLWDGHCRKNYLVAYLKKKDFNTFMCQGDRQSSVIAIIGLIIISYQRFSEGIVVWIIFFPLRNNWAWRKICLKGGRAVRRRARATRPWRPADVSALPRRYAEYGPPLDGSAHGRKVLHASRPTRTLAGGI